MQLEPNTAIAARLDEVARILAGQNANPYRVKAYERAAVTVRACPESLPALIEKQGIDGLTSLPGIGDHLARSIYQLATTGRLPMLDRLRGKGESAGLFATLPGIGSKTAGRIRDELGIQTLEELEVAAHDGRLERLGLGTKRVTGIRDLLGARLGRIALDRGPAVEPPDVAEILDVDRQYREEDARDALPRIAPRRFNPKHEAWLPILHTRRGDRDYTVLYSNTAHAHAAGRTHDWVVLYFDGHGRERQCTVITAQRGPLRGQRLIRGREDECLNYYSRTRH